MAPTYSGNPQPSAGSRYAIRGELDGSWTVYDVVSDAPAVYEEQMLVNLTFDLADVMLDHLNEVDAGSPLQLGPWGARYGQDD
jgi:hypothetical protein